MIIEFYLDKTKRPATAPSTAVLTSTGKKILEGYIVTPGTAHFFKNFGIQKGQTIQAVDVRKYVTDYVKMNNLQDQENKRYIFLPALLV